MTHENRPAPRSAEEIRRDRFGTPSPKTPEEQREKRLGLTLPPAGKPPAESAEQ